MLSQSMNANTHEEKTRTLNQTESEVEAEAETEATGVFGKINEHKIYLSLCMHFIPNIALLLSFATLFPPLACVLCIAIVKDILMYRWFLEQWISRTLFSKVKKDLALQTSMIHRIMNLQGIYLDMKRGIWIAIGISSMFWSFSLFDTLGDRVGVKHASWIVVVMNACPCLVYVASYYYYYYKAYRDHDRESMDGTPSTIGSTLNPLIERLARSWILS